MDVAMELICSVTVVKRQGGVFEDLSVVSSKSMNPTPNKGPFIVVRTSSDDTGNRYNLIGNTVDLITEFLNEGRVLICLKEPSYNLYINDADPDQLTEFITYLKKLLPKDSPPHISLEPTIPGINLYLDGQEKYKQRMKNIIDLDTNLDLVSILGIRNCTLELAGYQWPIAGAIRQMKNLTMLRLERIELCSSTFLEIESRELKKLHLSTCKTPLPIATLFKNDLCYKDSLVELSLEGNRWSEIPNGIFQFQNLLKLSLKINRITELPDKFANLSKLQELNLSLNRLTHLPPSIFQIQNLHKLSLQCNHVMELPAVFTNLPKLQTLELYYNELTRLPPSIFETQNLIRLSSHNNDITELPDFTTNSSKLQVLSLSHNQLRSLPTSIFECQNLSELSLINNHITELPDTFAKLSQLRVLKLSNNQLTSVPPSIFALQNLSKLYLSGNFISDLPNMLVNLPKLEALWLCNNRLSYVPSIIFEMQNLSQLSLQQNGLTELPDKFNNLPKLLKLSLSMNQLQYLPPSILLLYIPVLEIAYNAFNYDIFTPSFGSELIVHSLKELSYRTIINLNLIVKEGMLPKKFLKDLANYKQCICGCKFVHGPEVSFLSNLNISSLNYRYRNPRVRVPVNGNVCTSLKSCFLDCFPKCR